jgi:hypothetical protein
MSYKDPRTQLNENIIEESIKAFGDVPATYETLIDLTATYPTYIYTHLIIVNSLDTDTTIKLGDNEFTVQALKDIWFDNLRYNDVVEYKYKSGAPTVGNLQIICY